MPIFAVGRSEKRLKAIATQEPGQSQIRYKRPSMTTTVLADLDASNPAKMIGLQRLFSYYSFRNELESPGCGSKWSYEIDVSGHIKSYFGAVDRIIIRRNSGNDRSGRL
jgi:hypothetical protein